MTVLRHMATNLLTEEDWALLCLGGETVHVNDQEYLVSHGEPNEALYVLEEGDVSVLVPAPSGQGRVVVASMGEGEFFGELSMLSSKSTLATADIVAQCRRRAQKRPKGVRRKHIVVTVRVLLFVVWLIPLVCTVLRWVCSNLFVFQCCTNVLYKLGN